MSKGVSITVTGLDRLKKKLGSIPDDVAIAVDAQMSAIAEEFANDAATAAPVDLGLLKNSITHQAVGQMNHLIVSAAPYSAYVEFGTIERVSVPKGYEEFARQFKGKGIRKSGGIYPQPFFLPRIPEAQVKLRKEIPQAIAKALK